jgi:hypothetical protein
VVLVGPDDYDRLQASRALHAETRAARVVLEPGPQPLAAVPAGAFLPLALGLLGGWWQYQREKRSFALTFVFLGISTVGMIVFLNFTDHEVRDRDYFFQSGFHGYAMWIALGVAGSSSGCASRSRARAPGAGHDRLDGAARAAAHLLMSNLWFTHDRSHNYIARDYAYNMLATLKPNSFMFTNGDNDTFRCGTSSRSRASARTCAS